ncbi:IS3 family transposase [Streptomyces sp. NPDC005492]|uniref:IS3 family transposase n=1 Tax=Streptomyces sp. NPDC005492 TaxID=3156883 RepID=UPI0033A944F7
MSELCWFIHAEKANYPITLLCCVLRVARSSYYAWREGEAARRARQAADDALAHEITVLHLASRRTYGVPRIHAELRRHGRRVNRKRVARLMQMCCVTRMRTAKRFPASHPASHPDFGWPEPKSGAGIDVTNMPYVPERPGDICQTRAPGAGDQIDGRIRDNWAATQNNIRPVAHPGFSG